MAEMESLGEICLNCAWSIFRSECELEMDAKHVINNRRLGCLNERSPHYGGLGPIVHGVDFFNACPLWKPQRSWPCCTTTEPVTVKEVS